MVTKERQSRVNGRQNTQSWIHSLCTPFVLKNSVSDSMIAKCVGHFVLAREESSPAHFPTLADM